VTNGSELPLTFRFFGDLPEFVRPKRGEVQRTLREKTSVKDAIEACGVPHPEVDLILINGAPAGFGFQIEEAATIEVHPVTAPERLFPEVRLQRRNRERFLADGHLGKLARDLRLLGIDVAYDKTATDPQLVAQAAEEDRVLLTRDRRLLMHAAVRDGYFPRSQFPEVQIDEVLKRFHLRNRIAPHMRCLVCNGTLASVSKEEVLDQLEPLTRLYYEEFRRCRACGKIFWAGSHFRKLQARLARLLGDAPSP
jgi:uncharacterized protein